MQCHCSARLHVQLVGVEGFLGDAEHRVRGRVDLNAIVALQRRRGLLAKKSGNAFRVGILTIFREFARLTTRDAPPWGVRAEGQPKSN